METARPAIPDDLDAVARLWEEAVADLEGRRGGGLLAASLTRADLSAYLTAALTSPDRLIVVGLIDDFVPVGLASARAVRDLPVPVADLELIYVEPQARQIGVAERMLGVVTARCATWGVTGVDAPALPGSRSAKSFFETHGFQARLLVMHRSVAPVGEADLESGRG